MKEVEKDTNISYITDEDGNKTEIEIVTEFEREENGKCFVVYTEKYVDNGQPEFYVAEIATLEDGSEELIDIEDEDDMNYCQNVFDEFIDEMVSKNLSNEKEDEEEEEEVIVS